MKFNEWFEKEFEEKYENRVCGFEGCNVKDSWDASRKQTAQEIIKILEKYLNFDNVQGQGEHPHIDYGAIDEIKIKYLEVR